jgi:protein TonB
VTEAIRLTAAGAGRRPVEGAPAPASPGGRVGPAALSVLLHAGALAAVLLLLDRAEPRAPEQERGVALIWAEVADEAVGYGARDGAAFEAADAPAEPTAPVAPPAVAAPSAPAEPLPAPSPPPAPLPMAVVPPPPPPLPAAPAVLAAPPSPPEAPAVPVGDPPAPPALPAVADAAPAPPPPAAARPARPPPRPAPEPSPARAVAGDALRATVPSTNPFAGLGPDALALGPGRAEGAVTRSATPLAQPRFVYPPESERRGEQGTVVLLLHVDAQGQVAEVTLLSSSGHPALDHAAIAAARQWRFRPALRDGRPVGSTVRAPVTFRLQG